MATRLTVRWRRSLVGVAVGVGTVVICAQSAKAQVAYDLLHGFDACAVSSCLDPQGPAGPLIQTSDGTLYGTTFGGGDAGGGTIFKITAAGLATIHSFDCSIDGCGPVAGVIQASDGNLYGTTASGGPAGGGTVFKVTDAGILTTLHSFPSDCTGGCFPKAGLLQASDGTFYGTTDSGGTAGCGGGTVFKIAAAGFATLHSFDCSGGGTEGYSPRGGLIQANGAFYGTTETGGASFGGTVFRITADGNLTTLHSFDCVTEGCFLMAGLIQAKDGNFYGTTSHGGTILPGVAGSGTIFRITPAGALTILHTFEGFFFEGGRPTTALIQASDDNFYGTTAEDIRGTSGSVFKITAAGTFTTLHFFPGDRSEGSQDDTNPPHRGLIQASDGNFYGTAPSGGPGSGGVLYRLVGHLSALGPASVWIGLKNSDDVGLRLDLLAEVFAGGTKVGEGRLDNVSAGGSGFNNATLRVIPLALTGGPVDFPVVAALEVKLSARRTCSGGGHASGIARLWYGGHPFGARRDADSRLEPASDAVTTDPDDIARGHFLRAGFALSTTPGRSRRSIDVSVDTKQACPNRPFKSFGTWSNSR